MIWGDYKFTNTLLSLMLLAGYGVFCGDLLALVFELKLMAEADFPFYF